MVDNGQDKINQTVEKQRKKVISLIEDALEDISLEIGVRKSGEINNDEIPSLLQLESILNEIDRMKTALSPKVFLPTFTRQIVDSWDIQSKLGDKLLRVVQEYKKLN